MKLGKNNVEALTAQLGKRGQRAETLLTLSRLGGASSEKFVKGSAASLKAAERRYGPALSVRATWLMMRCRTTTWTRMWRATSGRNSVT